jgi:hypothetical protein
METIVYVVTALLAIAWSVYIYIRWSEWERRGEYVVGRFFHLVGPSGYFLLLVLAGWSRSQVLRLDLIGLAVYDALIVVCWVGLLLATWLHRAEPRRTLLGFLVSYHVLALVLVLGVYLVRLFPPLLIPISSWVSQVLRKEFFRFAWMAVNPETHQQDVASMANKVLIALLSYIPISLIRSILVNRQISRQRREMYRELEDLKKRVAELERGEKSKERPTAGSR